MNGVKILQNYLLKFTKPTVAVAVSPAMTKGLRRVACILFVSLFLKREMRHIFLEARKFSTRLYLTVFGKVMDTSALSSLPVPRDAAEQEARMRRFLTEWKDILDNKHIRQQQETAQKFRDLFHPTDFAFYSPVVHSPYREIDTVSLILKWITEVLQDFVYTQTTKGYDHEGNPLLVLYFTAAVFDKDKKKLAVEGADFFKLDRKSGKVTTS